ncbi:hypothetical protein BGZ73_002557 [Actinomortierella ambigua]|nr:hypothetical protein BGZ73_002557 [Actinomortierella ambigua]
MNPPDKKDYPILWWKSPNQPWIANYTFDFCDLPYNCHTTTDQSKYNDSPLILVSEHEMHNDLPPKEDIDSGKKALVYYTVEAPKWYDLDPKIMHQFSYRFTYHPNSDFVFPYLDHTLVDDVLRPPMTTLERRNELRKHGLQNDGRGLAPIAWFVSNCNTNNERRYFVHQLRKYIDVDIYGHCEPTREWPKDANGQELNSELLASYYKFYLAIENSNCNFYVTEKLQRPYYSGTVPIVDGPKDYRPYAATHNALLVVDDYTPKTLAEYIKQLDANDDMYLNHIRYKYPKDPNYRPTIHDLAPAFVRTWVPQLPENKTNYYQNHLPSTPPSWRNSFCTMCELVHDVTEGLVQLDPTKRLKADNNCVVNKHAHPSWVIEYHLSRNIHLILGIIALVIGLVLFLFWRPVRRVWAPHLRSFWARCWNRDHHASSSSTPYIPLANSPKL